MELDRDADGHLSRLEIIEASKVAASLVCDYDSIFVQVDSDGNGFISYSEFITRPLTGRLL
jgi:Ca2+-binding EF-hand superfamily protein